MTRLQMRLLPGMLALLITACGQAPETTDKNTLPPGSPYADGAQYPWTDRLDPPVADPYALGRNYPWTSATAASELQAQAVNSGINVLSDLPWTSATNAWGPVERNASNGQKDVHDGRAITIGGVTYAKGLGVHADSDIHYTLNGQCSNFSAAVGLDDEVGKLGRVTFQVLGDGRVIYDSGELTGADTARRVSVAVGGVRDLLLRVVKGTDNYYDHADWADAKVTCAVPAPSGSVYVSDLAYTAATNGWGPVELDRSNGEQLQGDGRPLSIRGITFAKGLGVHADSRLTYALSGACTAFQARVGVDDETAPRGSVVFQVFGDGRKLFDSGSVPGDIYAQTATADVTGVNELSLVVTGAGDGRSYDHADWADARLSCGAATKSGRVDTTFGAAGYAVNPPGSPENRDMVTEPDGSVVVLGQEFSIKRLSPAGTVSAAGRADIPGEPPRTDGFSGGSAALAMTRQANGNLLVVGYSYDHRVVIVRFLPNLRPDPTFGTGGIFVKQLGDGTGSDFYTAASSSATNVAVMADGRVVLVGGATRPYQGSDGKVRAEYMVARLTASGQLDPSFGTGGVVTVTGPQVSSRLQGFASGYLADVAIQSDGRIVAAGSSGYDLGALPAALRFLPDGRLDATFSGDGISTFTVQPDSTRDAIFALRLQLDGKVLIGGSTGRTPDKAFVLRLTSSGAVDARNIFRVGEGSGNVTALAIQGDGRIVFGARGDSAFTAGRLTASLQLDPTFGEFGTGLVRPSRPDGGPYAYDASYSVEVDPQNRVLVMYFGAVVRLTP